MVESVRTQLSFNLIQLYIYVQICVTRIRRKLRLFPRIAECLTQLILFLVNEQYVRKKKKQKLTSKSLPNLWKYVSRFPWDYKISKKKIDVLHIRNFMSCFKFQIKFTVDFELSKKNTIQLIDRYQQISFFFFFLRLFLEILTAGN